MLTLNDGRKEMYQWDIGRIATVDVVCDVVHFSNLKYGASLSVEVKNGEVAIPNKLLTSGEPIYCWAFVADENGNYTKQEQTLNVNKRAKPSDYVYTETETLTWKSLDERITELEKGGTGGSDAVKYTAQELTDEQKAQARANIGAVSVDEVPEQVQVDWNQSDKKQLDYVKNRTHYTYTVHNSGYMADLMDSTHNIGDIVLLRAIPISILDRIFIPGINASYRSEYSFHLVYKVTFYEGTDVYESENDKECIANEEMEISEFSTGNIKVLYHNKRVPSIALYIIYDLTTLNDEDKTKFAKTGIYAQLVSLNTYDTATSILVGYRSIKYVKLDSKYLNIPVATNDVAGVVKPVTKTNEMSQDVGVDADGRLYTIPIASTMTGATADTDGASGLVPQPKAGQHGKFLRGDGTWADVPQGGGGGTGNGDMQKTVYDPMGKATDVFAYAENTAESKVSAHNTESGSHSDIRELITGLTNRLNVLADSDDETLDQLSEIVAYIKSNKSLIDAITTNKVSVSDIVDNLTSSATNKPLSAAQGKALKELIDGITIPDKLPNPNALTFTGAVTVSYDGSEPVEINIPSGGGGADNPWRLIKTVILTETVKSITVDTDNDNNAFALSEIYVNTNATNSDDQTNNTNVCFNINGKKTFNIGTNSPMYLPCGKTKESGRNWIWIMSLNPFRAIHGSWLTSSTSSGKNVYCYQANEFNDINPNPHSMGERITSVEILGATSTSFLSAGSEFRIYGR